MVLVVNTGFGVVQELRAKRELDGLAILTAARARVVREGVTAEIAVDQVVLDDVLELRPGDQVPVDGVVLRDDGLEVDEALLTGEAEPVAKPPDGFIGRSRRTRHPPLHYGRQGGAFPCLSSRSRPSRKKKALLASASAISPPPGQRYWSRPLPHWSPLQQHRFQ